MVEFIDDCNAYQLGDHLWSGAVDTFNTLVDMGKVDMLDDYFAEIFCDKTPTLTEINDILWFESEHVFEYCGLNADGELPTAFDKLEETYLVNDMDLENMKESELFTKGIIEDLEEQINSSQSGLATLMKEDIKNEEQAEWVTDNL